MDCQKGMYEVLSRQNSLYFIMCPKLCIMLCIHLLKGVQVIIPNHSFVNACMSMLLHFCTFSICRSFLNVYTWFSDCLLSALRCILTVNSASILHGVLEIRCLSLWLCACSVNQREKEKYHLWWSNIMCMCKKNIFFFNQK